jgi:hypothetical protein
MLAPALPPIAGAAFAQAYPNKRIPLIGSQIVAVPNYLAVGANSDIKSVEFIAAAKGADELGIVPGQADR